MCLKHQLKTKKFSTSYAFKFFGINLIFCGNKSKAQLTFLWCQKLSLTTTLHKVNFQSRVFTQKITDNRKFWHAGKPFLSDKFKSRENIILANYEEITSDEMEVAITLNNFFSNIKNLKIQEYYVEDKLPHSLAKHPTLKSILKYKNHPSISIIKGFFRPFSSFYLSQVDKDTVLKEIRKLNMNKAVQYRHPSTNIKRKCWVFCWIYLPSI